MLPHRHPKILSAIAQATHDIGWPTLVKRMKIPYQNMNHWRYRGVPVQFAVKFANAVKATHPHITKEFLRPDVFK